MLADNVLFQPTRNTRTTHMNTLSFFKKTLLGLGLAILTAACLSDDIEDQSTLDDQNIQAFLDRQDIIAERTDSGLRYLALEEGSGARVTANQIVDVFFDLKLFGSTQSVQIDSSYVFRPQTGSFLPGLTEGVQLMRQGDRYRFYIPSRLAFGFGSGTLNGAFIPVSSSFAMEVAVNDLRTDSQQRAHEAKLLDDYLLTYAKDSILSIDRRPTGVIRAVLKEGTGERSPQHGNRIFVGYEGRFLDGQVFDRNNGISFTLDTARLIKGWYDAISEMKQDEEALILIPSHRAYGEQGNVNIPPFKPLVFRVRLDTF